MDTTTSSTETARAAETIRNSAAWWRRAADQLEAGDLDGATTSAKLATFGTETMVDRIVALASGDGEETTDGW